MHTIPLQRSLLHFLDQLEYTEAALSAHPDTVDLAPLYREAIDDWKRVFDTQRSARRELTRANALVSVRDDQLDTLTAEFGVHLLAEVRGDRKSSEFRLHFSSAPSELIRMPLRKQCEHTLHVMVPELHKRPAKHPLRAFANRLESAAKSAAESLDARTTARANASRAGIEVDEWKEGVNTLRLGTYATLLRIAAEKKYPRSWADTFFARLPHGAAEQDEEPAEPAPTPPTT